MLSKRDDSSRGTVELLSIVYIQLVNATHTYKKWIAS